MKFNKKPRDASKSLKNRSIGENSNLNSRKYSDDRQLSEGPDSTTGKVNELVQFDANDYLQSFKESSKYESRNNSILNKGKYNTSG